MILSIVVLSYNRPEKIERILFNLINVHSEKFNLIVKDDCSPRQNEIELIVQSYAEKSNFEMIFYKNKENLGYDKNLLDAFNVTDSEYVFLLSDDDFIDGVYLSGLVDMLERREFKVYFTPYKNNDIVYRVNIRQFELKRFEEVIYNSILFSGIVLDRSAVLALPKDERFLSKCIYTQVYLSSLLVYKEKAFGESPRNLLYLGGDGENFFGKNQSAINRDVLQDRSSITSNFRYQKFLLSVVYEVAKCTDWNVFKRFMFEYNKRLISYLLRARSFSLGSFYNLAYEIKKSQLKLTWYLKVTIFIIPFVPSNLAGAIVRYAARLLRNAG